MGLRYDSPRRKANREKAERLKKEREEKRKNTPKTSLSYDSDYRTAKRQKTNEKRQTRITDEIKRINKGGKTYFKSKEDSLSSLKEKLKNVKSKLKGSSSKKSKLKIEGAGDTPGAARAKAAALARKNAGLNTVTGKKKGVKKKRKVTTWRDLE